MGGAIAPPAPPPGYATAYTCIIHTIMPVTQATDGILFQAVQTWTTGTTGVK